MLDSQLTVKTSTIGDNVFQTWKISYKSLCYLRWISWIYLVLGLLYLLIIEYPTVGKPFFYMTNWGHILGLIYFTLVLVYTHKYESQEKRETGGHSLYKAINIFCQITFSLETLICIFFWTLLFGDVMTKNANKPYPQNVEYIILNVILHAFSPLCIFLEVTFNMIPFDLRRGAFSVTVLTLVYTVVNYIGTLVLGYPIYKPISWNSFMTAVFLAIAYILCMGGFYLGYRLQKWKTYRNESLLEGLKNYENISDTHTTY
mmetsp:Transcript_70941/g.82588  ORF Transcript_70941/g.82588 Transcript_70941/m.82588 type:complete len:259 (+) Transcript_70941:21-797(+)